MTPRSLVALQPELGAGKTVTPDLLAEGRPTRPTVAPQIAAVAREVIEVATPSGLMARVEPPVAVVGVDREKGGRGPLQARFCVGKVG